MMREVYLRHICGAHLSAVKMPIIEAHSEANVGTHDSSDMSEPFLSVEALETEGLDLPLNAMRRDAEPLLRQGAYVEGLGRG